MSVTINGTSGVTFNDASNQTTAATGFGFKNRIINGAMTIDQRNAGASVTPTDGQLTLDRWKSRLTQASKYSVRQMNGVDSTASNYEAGSAPAGFSNSQKITSLSAYSVGVSDYFFLAQLIEGFNAADFGWGTANAQTVTLSFWVRSSLTGTFGGSFRAGPSTRSYAFSYTISSANTWEQKTITVAGDTSGTWSTNNTAWGEIDFGLGVGSNFSGTTGSWASTTYLSATGATSVVGTNGATFYITGVQLEKGSTATSFDYRPYGTELALCQRYLPMISSDSGDAGFFASGQAGASTSAQFYLKFPVTTRAVSTGLTIDAVGNLRCTNAGISGSPTVTALTFLSANLDVARISASVASGLVAGNATLLIPVSTVKILFTGCEL